MDIKKYNKLNSRLISEWKKLWEYSNSAHFFNSPEWFIVNLKTYKYKKILVVAAYKKNILVGILPLVQGRVYGISVYTDMNNFFSEKSSILVKNKSTKILNNLLNVAFEEGDLLLREISEDNTRNIKVKGARKFPYLSSVSPYLMLGDEHFAYMSKEQKSKIKNKIKKNSKITHRVVKKVGLEELQLMRKIEENSVKKVSGKTILSDSRNYELFQNIIKNASKFLRLDIIEHKGKEIVYGLGLICKDKYLAYLTSFDKRFKGLSPGKILVFFILKSLKDERKILFDFARGFSVLKKEFTKIFILQYDIYLVRSFWVCMYFKVINRMRRIKMILVNQKNNYDNLFLFKTI